MITWLSQYIDPSLMGWGSLATIAIGACAVIGWFFPPFRKVAIAAGAAAAAAFAIYAKGNRDRAALDQQRNDEAVKKVQDEYSKIDARPDDVKSTTDRMCDGSF